METADLVVVGAGAAGLMTAIACARHAPELRIVCLDSARTIGAKILVSGGARCNVTNRVVTERDFWGGPSRIVRDVLRAFPASRTAAFFEEIGVALHEEADAKLFPDTNRARTVLDALLAEAGRLGVVVTSDCRVDAVHVEADGFAIEARNGLWRSRSAVLATGGLSLPKSGSDGYGYELARRLGHGHVATTPALVPLLVEQERLRDLSGVSHAAALTIRAESGSTTHMDGAVLWTHFGASGPVVLNASRHWHRAVLDGQQVHVTVNLCPGESFADVDQWIRAAALERPRASVATVLAARLPASVAAAWVAGCGLDAGITMAHMSREDRRALVHALVETPLHIRGSRGYTYAEATAGGVPLTEIVPATMESRVCRRLYIVGEILDVDGRIGGFNFQWAWSTGWVAGRAIAKALVDSRPGNRG